MAVHPAIARRLLEQPIIEGNLEAIDQIMPPDAVVHPLIHDPVIPDGVDRGNVSGPELLKRVVSAQRSAFPDLHVEIDQFLDAGHTITALCTLSGTARNGRSAAWHFIAIMHFHDSKVVEMWYIADRLGMYQQLGVVPESSQLLGELRAG